MAKFKRRRIQRVYPNKYSTTWSPDEQQASLIPGTDFYNQRQADKLIEGFSAKKEEEELSEDLKLEIAKEEPENKVDDEANTEFTEHVVYNVGSRKYRRRMSKQYQVKEVKKIAEEALIKFPGDESIEEELHDDSVNEDTFKGEVLRDYDRILDGIERSDNDHDGDVDGDDILPGMYRMRKYM